MRRWKANNNYGYYYSGEARSPSTPNPKIPFSHQHNHSNLYYSNPHQFVLKCTDLPQYDACIAQANMIQNDDKLHLRNLCNDANRCASLIAIHTSKLEIYKNDFAPRRQHKIILDYSRQRVTGETMEQLFDLADAVGIKDRTEAMYAGKRINTTEDRPVLHHVLRMPSFYDYEVVTEVSPPAVVISNTSPSATSTATSAASVHTNNLERSAMLAQRAVSDATNASSTSSSSAPPITPTNSTFSTIPLSPGSMNNYHLTGSATSASTINTNSFTSSTNSTNNNPASSFVNDPIRAVLHHSTSNSSAASTTTRQQANTSTRSDSGVFLQGHQVLKQVNEYRSKIQEFVFRVRNGEYSSIVNHDISITNFLVVADGSCTLGPQAVATALSSNAAAMEAAGPYRQLRFCSNIDPVDIVTKTKDWKASKTLIILISTNFAPGDPILLLARTVQTWLLNDISYYHKSAMSSLTREEIISRHMIAITGNPNRCHLQFPEIDTIFTVPSWVSTRFSLFSPIGLVPLSLKYSYPIIQEVMEGAHDIDEHFFQTPLRDNIPVILGLLGVWNSTFLGCSCRAIIPYSEALSDFPAYVQHIDMESNGKRVAVDGSQLLHRSGEVTFGSVGSTCEDSFFQLLHQGRVVPVDFIGFMESPKPIEFLDEAVSNHDELMSNFFAQPDALAYGKTLVDLIQEGTPEPLREHMVFTGNRPSTSILMTRLDAFSIGQLMALYEHRSAVQGFIWGINSFDSYGNELGRTLAKHVRAQLSASRKTGASVQGFNGSTSALLEHYLAHGKQQQQQQIPAENKPSFL